MKLEVIHQLIESANERRLNGITGDLRKRIDEQSGRLDNQIANLGDLRRATNEKLHDLDTRLLNLKPCMEDVSPFGGPDPCYDGLVARRRAIMVLVMLLPVAFGLGILLGGALP